MDEMNRKIIGNRIKELRKKKHLTQFQLAELVDVSTVYVSYIENGKRQLSLDNLINIANVLEVSCDDILVLNHNTRAYHTDIEDLLKDCNVYEKKFLLILFSLSKTLFLLNQIQNKKCVHQKNSLNLSSFFICFNYALTSKLAVYSIHFI